MARSLKCSGGRPWAIGVAALGLLSRPITALAQEQAAPEKPAESRAASAAEPEPAREQPNAASAAELAELERRYRELLERQAATEKRLHELELRPTPRVGSAPSAPAPLAGYTGYSEKGFFLRDQNDTFVLMPRGRLNVDEYTFLNRGSTPAGPTNGPADTRPKNTVFVRRARFGFAGTWVKLIDFRAEAEFASLPTAGQYSTVTDASLIFNSNPYFKIEFGQTYTPFMLEGQTSENYTDFIERSAAVRFATPQSRDAGLMFFGALPHNLARYSVGVFNGDGQNFKNLDDHPAYIGRLTVSPLGALPEKHAEWLDELWLGASFWHQRATNLGGAVAPSVSGATQGDLSSVTTQSGLAIFSSNYGNGVDASGNAIRSHLAPDGLTDKYAFELNLPFGERFGARGEYMHQSIELREYQDTSSMGNATRTRAARGKFVGSGGYGELYVWLGGHVATDRPGVYLPPHWYGFRPAPAPEWSLLLAAKYERLDFAVEGLPNESSASGKSVADAGVGHYALDVYELGASLYYTRHSRIALNYVLNRVGDGGEQAASTLKKNLFYKKAENELLFRWAVSF